MSRPRLRALAVIALLAALAVAATGARSLLVTEMPGRSFVGPLPPLSPVQADLAVRLEAHVSRLAGHIGERNLFRYRSLLRAAEYVEASFVAAGHEPRSQAYVVDGKAVRNIETELLGTHPEAGIIVVGAHYDSVLGSPGANDNASGVAAMLELARLLHDRKLARTVRLVAFANEEPPFFYTDSMGSVRYATRAAERGERIAAMLSLETIGYYSDEPGSQHFPFPLGFFYKDTGNFVGFVGNLRSQSLVRRATAAFRRHARFPSEGLAAPGWLTGVGWSDHWSFWRAGFSAIMVTDTAPYRYPAYHSPLDRPHEVDYERLARVVDGLVAVVVELAGCEGPRVEAGGER